MSEILEIHEVTQKFGGAVIAYEILSFSEPAALSSINNSIEIDGLQMGLKLGAREESDE